MSAFVGSQRHFFLHLYLRSARWLCGQCDMSSRWGNSQRTGGVVRVVLCVPGPVCVQRLPLLCYSEDPPMLEHKSLPCLWTWLVPVLLIVAITRTGCLSLYRRSTPFETKLGQDLLLGRCFADGAVDLSYTVSVFSSTTKTREVESKTDVWH